MGVTRPTKASSESVRRSMQANKSRDTKPELALRKAAHALGLRYRVSIRPVPSIRRTADMVFTRAKVAVFLDGCFWHGCPDHHTTSATNAEYWAEKVRCNRERDGETDKILAEAGWRVLRIWEHADPAEAAKCVAELVRRAPLQRSRRPGRGPDPSVIAGLAEDRTHPAPSSAR